MSALTKTIIGAGLALTLGAAAYASDATDWQLSPGQAYVVDMKGHTMKVGMKAPSAQTMAHAQEVPHGTVFFIHDGKLMMAFDPGMVAEITR
jgi:hypothetical protein